MEDIQLGMKARDRLSDFEGVVFDVGRYIDGSLRVCVKSREMHEGRPVDDWFDQGQLHLKDIDHESMHVSWGQVPLPDPLVQLGDMVQSKFRKDLQGPVVARFDYLYGCSSIRIINGELSERGTPAEVEYAEGSWEVVEEGAIPSCRSQTPGAEAAQEETDATGGVVTSPDGRAEINKQKEIDTMATDYQALKSAAVKKLENEETWELVTPRNHNKRAQAAEIGSNYLRSQARDDTIIRRRRSNGRSCDGDGIGSGRV